MPSGRRLAAGAGIASGFIAAGAVRSAVAAGCERRCGFGRFAVEVTVTVGNSFGALGGLGAPAGGDGAGRSWAAVTPIHAIWSTTRAAKSVKLKIRGVGCFRSPRLDWKRRLAAPSHWGNAPSIEVIRGGNMRSARKRAYLVDAFVWSRRHPLLCPRGSRFCVIVPLSSVKIICRRACCQAATRCFETL
jgi:hypothetical protein